MTAHSFLRPQRFASGLIVIALTVGISSAHAWVATGDVWGVPVVEITTNLGTLADRGGTDGPLRDGSASFDESFAQAAARWNSSLSRLQLVVTADHTMIPGNGDLQNQVFFDEQYYGHDFGEAAAITTGFFYETETGSETAEQDIIFNTSFEWDSYRGELVEDSTGVRYLQDFRRVAIHELGHLIGLNHPNGAQPPQSVVAVMNSGENRFIDDLQTDDVVGGNSIYQNVVFPGPEETLIVEEDPAYTIQLAGPTVKSTRTRKRAAVFRGTAVGGTKVALQNRRTGTTKYFQVSADGSWRGRMSLELGRNRFIIVVVTPEGFAGALTKTTVVRKSRRQRPKR